MASAKQKRTSDAEEDIDNECGICYEEFQTRGKMDCCDHMYCFSCIRRWCDVENSCPMCKRPITSLVRQAKVSETKSLIACRQGLLYRLVASQANDKLWDQFLNEFSKSINEISGCPV